MREHVDNLIREQGLPEAGRRCKVAAVLFTYRCSIACRHCLFGSAPDRPDVVMTARQCADALALLHQTGRVIHIAGGEAMLYWDVLAESVKVSAREGNAPHFIETNCSFAVDDEVVRERFGFLRDHGVAGILASADPYHQEHVPPDRFLRVRALTREIFGDKMFWGPGQDDRDILALPELVKDEARLREHVRANPPTMVGTAFSRLAGYLDRLDPRGALPLRGWTSGGSAEQGCLKQFASDTLWELHIDPYGNLQTNCGIILGRVPDQTPVRLLEQGPENANRFVRALCSEGAAGLAELAAREHGFVWPETVSQACELCFITRRFLRRFHPDVFGPAEVY